MALVPRTNRKTIIKKTVSSQKTPAATDHWHAHTGNSVSLDTAGYWKVTGTVDFGRSSGAPYDNMKARWGSANGADSASVPAAIGSQLIFGTDYINLEVEDIVTGALATKMNDIIVLTTTPLTVFLNTFSSDNAAGFANQRIQVHIIAEYMGPADFVTVG